MRIQKQLKRKKTMKKDRLRRKTEKRIVNNGAKKRKPDASRVLGWQKLANLKFCKCLLIS